MLRSGGSLTLHLALDESNRLFRDVEHAVEVRLRRRQRWFELEHVASYAAKLRNQTVVQREVPGFAAGSAGGRLGRAVFHKVNADEQTWAANVADDIEAAGQLLESLCRLRTQR